MRYAITGAVFLWLAATAYFLLSWDFSPDTFLEGASMVICLGGIVLGLIGVVLLIVSGILSGRREKKQWS
jgi:hypothetical protein